MGDGGHARTAMRRRQRRLRQWLRHERLNVAVAVVKNNHHSAPRRATMARAREEESDEMNNAMGQKTPPRAASTVYFSVDDDGDVLPARPTPPGGDEYFEYNSALWKQAWDQEHQCYCWCEVRRDDGYCFLPVYRPLEVIPEGTVTWSRPGTWSRPCDSSCSWIRPGAKSWPSGPCTRWRASCCPPTVTSLKTSCTSSSSPFR